MFIYSGFEEVKRSGQDFVIRLVYISRTCLKKIPFVVVGFFLEYIIYK